MTNQASDRTQVSRCLACETLYEPPVLDPMGSPGVETTMRFDTGIRTVKVGGVVVHQCRSEHRDPDTGRPEPDPATGKFVFRPVESADPPRNRPLPNADPSYYGPRQEEDRGQVRMKEHQAHTWQVSGNVWLHREVVVAKEGVRSRLAIYPATIVQARYNGAYEGAPWLCFPLHVQQLTEQRWRNWDGDEIECQGFWRGAQVQGLLIGLGDSPTAAYDHLIDQACARVGLDRAALTKEPA